MYENHFGLSELPFSITPDTDFFYRSNAAQQALNTVLVAVRAGEGFIKVTGEVGTGKTLLCRSLLRALGKRYQTAYLPVPSRSALGLLVDIAEELGIDLGGVMQKPEPEQAHALLRLLRERLLILAHAGRRVLVCLDEAQALSIRTLESLRLLTNLETEKFKLVQVLVVGQPELDAKLAHPAIRQLRQRITFQHRLQPLRGTEMGGYLDHRLRRAGYSGPPVFSLGALTLLQWATRGYPRMVNIVAHKSLICAFGRGRLRVGIPEMLVALGDDHGWLRWPSRHVLAGMGACLAGVALLQWVRMV